MTTLLNDKLNVNQCRNCGEMGHRSYKCSKPIKSYGIICARYNPTINRNEYLMVRRKDSYGYFDILCGRFSKYNMMHLQFIIDEMTENEKEQIATKSYPILWKKLWNKNNTNHDKTNLNKFTFIKQQVLPKMKYKHNNIAQHMFGRSKWNEPEWGFPKGKCEINEQPIQSAFREFHEETGISPSTLKLYNNLEVYTELFIGSDFKQYMHQYYICNMDYDVSCKQSMTNFQRSEVGDIKWCNIDECIENIRPINYEKTRVIKDVDIALTLSLNRSLNMMGNENNTNEMT